MLCHVPCDLAESCPELVGSGLLLDDPVGEHTHRLEPLAHRDQRGLIGVQALLLKFEGLVGDIPGLFRGRLLAGVEPRLAECLLGEPLSVFGGLDLLRRRLNSFGAADRLIGGPRPEPNLQVAEQYVAAFANLARTNNTLIVPSNLSDLAGLVATATTVFKAQEK